MLAITLLLVLPWHRPSPLTRACAVPHPPRNLPLPSPSPSPTLTLSPPSLPLASPLPDEYAPAIGLQFYGTTGDTLIVERAGEAYYKPRGHADGLQITLNESLMITPAVLEAGAAASAASSGGRRLNAKGKPMSYDELIKDTRAGSGHPAFKDAFKGVAKVNRDEAPAGPMRRMLEEASPPFVPVAIPNRIR